MLGTPQAQAAYIYLTWFRSRLNDQSVMLAHMHHQSCTYRCCGDCTVQQSRQAAICCDLMALRRNQTPGIQILETGHLKILNFDRDMSHCHGNQPLEAQSLAGVSNPGCRLRRGPDCCWPNCVTPS